jgi:DNA adenine methylase
MTIKPILKWVGGKTQIIHQLLGHFPREINNYHEIFLGGGSVLLTLLDYIKTNKISVSGRICAYDLNEALIYVYKNIQSNYTGLYNTIETLINEYNSISEIKGGDKKPTNITEAKISKENYYYWIRKQYNLLEDKKSLLSSAYFIFLNKTGFRGMYRVGPNGFNIPFGNYKNPEIVSLEHLKEVSDLIKDVSFEHLCYSKSIERIQEGDTVYMDPPYAPENKKSFVGYTEDGFDLDAHLNLFKMCNNLTRVNFIMSNACVDLVKDNFKTDKYELHPIECKRSINSKNPGAKTTEVIIKNLN